MDGYRLAKLASLRRRKVEKDRYKLKVTSFEDVNV
jgi:hypothetical protein